MWKEMKTKVVASLLACACVFAGAGFGVAVEGVRADVGGENDNPPVTQSATGLRQSKVDFAFGHRKRGTYAFTYLAPKKHF